MRDERSAVIVWGAFIRSVMALKLLFLPTCSIVGNRLKLSALVEPLNGF